MYDTEPYEKHPNDFHQCFEYVTHDTRCTETAIKGEYFCPTHRISPSPIIIYPDGGFRLPPLTDRDSIFRLASEIAQRLADKSVDPKRASKILYACQVANSALDGKLRDQKLALQQQKAATNPESVPQPSGPVILTLSETKGKDPCFSATTTAESTLTPCGPIVHGEG